ncbi:Ribonuclease H-like domain,HAT, C-terminal dimerisation domain [Cinara cedri]|uniref:Ribonuclease H-like domain,HAT, C-terminal dimerisation domain n=1 Tax=Cinara cedri TaxID=506608 RepID=A0A5E4MHP9_9HEMI|nr:Ribonuclease H-like domain,HAT, C-terminal dimerisation domain [Cinara cedri]
MERPLVYRTRINGHDRGSIQQIIFYKSPKIVLQTAVNALNSLLSFVREIQNKYEEYEEKAKDMSGLNDYAPIHNRKKNVRLSSLNNNQTASTQLLPREKFRSESFISVIDQLTVSLTERIAAYETICQRFGFLNTFEKLETSELQSAANYLVSIYPNDLESSLGNEFIQFSSFVKIYVETRKDNEQWEIFLYRIIVENNLQCTFPNIEVVLRIYLVLMVSNCSGERSFSKMKLIKNRLRTSMTQSRLSTLALLSVESDILRALDFSQVVEKFAATKSRKVAI